MAGAESGYIAFYRGESIMDHCECDNTHKNNNTVCQYCFGSWIEKHSVNCYFCGYLVDERECLPADEFNDNDGGEICPDCVKKYD